MNILFCLHGFPPYLCAGAEFMAYEIATYLAQAGHDVNIISPTHVKKEPVNPNFDLRGVKVHWDLEKAEWGPLFSAAHVVITHLDNTRSAITEAKKYNKPVAHIIHNGGQLHHHSVRPEEADLVLYNSFHLANAMKFPAPSFLLYPPVTLANYQVPRTPNSDCYSLVNLNDNKGGHLFWTLAEQFRGREFLGQKGSYGEQIMHSSPLPNVTIWENSSDVKRVYARTHVLLMPSKSETWGRVAIEAASNGIPIIANPATGLREALGENGAIWVRWDRTYDWITAIKSLDDRETYLRYSRAGLARAKELEQISLLQLTALEHALFAIAHSSRKRVFSLTSETQYTDHMAPVLHAMPSENIGFTVVANNGHSDYTATLKHAYLHNLTLFPVPDTIPNFTSMHMCSGRIAELESSCMLVSSWRDQQLAVKTRLKDKVVRMEHGAGQSYSDMPNPAFLGGPGHRGLLAALVPGFPQLQSLREAEPELPAYIIGCPKLDFWSMRRSHAKADSRINVAVSFRYNLGMDADAIKQQKIAPEQCSAFKSFRLDFENLTLDLADPTKRTQMALVGHGHPYALEALAPWWKGLHVPTCADWDTVLVL